VRRGTETMIGQRTDRMPLAQGRAREG